MMILRRIDSRSTQALPLIAPIILIGKALDADISLQDEGSGLEDVALKLEKRDGVYHAENITGRGHIRLNGQKLGVAPLAPGDRLEIGPYILILDHETKAPEIVPGPLPVSSAKTGATPSLLENLNAFSRTAAREKDTEKLLQEALNLVLAATAGTEAFLFTLSHQGTPELIVSSGVKDAKALFSDTIVQDVLASGKGIAIPNTLLDPQYAHTQSIVDLKLRTVLCVPIASGGKTIGLIYVGCRKAQISYDEKDLENLELYSLIAGMLIHNVDYIARQRESIRRLAKADTDGGVVGHSPALMRILDQIVPIAPSEIGVLLQGETGTGKDVIAQYIHLKSERATQPFIAVNCSSLAKELLESELFGYKKGAFTGAIADRRGLFQAAHGGTLFLDEIGEMDLNLQSKLLRVLESGMVRPVGGVVEEEVNVRVLAATNRDLQRMVSEGSFREDLFYRLAQVILVLPPLRERGEDILLLAYHFLEKFKAKYPNKAVEDFHPDAIQALLTHEWPGNVRELANIIHKSVLMATSPLVTLDAGSFKQKFPSLDETTKRFQRNYITRALVMSQGDKERAAALLGMSRSTFFRYLSQLEVE